MVISTSPLEDESTASKIAKVALALANNVRGEIRRDEEMARHTTFRVGGPADLFLLPYDEDDLSVMLALLCEHEIPVCVVGNGSNILVADKGIRGAVIRLTPRFSAISREDDIMTVGAGTKLARAIQFAAAEELSGLESMMGIPGTIGGALVMNAGIDFGTISDWVESISCITMTGEKRSKKAAELDYCYRRSALQGSGLIVLEARLKLMPEEREKIHDKMTRLEAKRTSRQPTRSRTAGSTFKNSEGFDAAGKMLDHAGCKGHRIGGAEVSSLHANFIVTHQDATADDVRRLACWMQHKVRQEINHHLAMEVEMLGDWQGWTEE